MYTGPTTIHEKRYTDRWTQGLGTYSVCLGTVPVAMHGYTCEHCGRTYAFEAQAEEPFYCHSAVCEGVRLVGITAAPEEEPR